MARKNISKAAAAKKAAAEKKLGVQKTISKAKANKEIVDAPVVVDAPKQERFYRRWPKAVSNKLTPVTSRLPSLPSKAFTLELLAESLVLGSAVLVNQHGFQMPSVTLEAARQGAIAVASSTVVIGGLKGAGAAITSGSSYAYNKAASLLPSLTEEKKEEEVQDKPKAKKGQKAKL